MLQPWKTLIQWAPCWIAVASSSFGFTLFDAGGFAWNGNKFTSNSMWSGGDFNADGVVDGADFIAWNENKFQSAVAVASVPEPHCLLAMGLILWVCARPFRPCMRPRF